MIEIILHIHQKLQIMCAHTFMWVWLRLSDFYSHIVICTTYLYTYIHFSRDLPIADWMDSSDSSSEYGSVLKRTLY